MALSPIDLASWNRKEHYLKYIGADFPYISLGADLDVTALYRYCKQKGISFYLAMLHEAYRASLAVENFAYRKIKEQPYVCDKTYPAFTWLPKGSDLYIVVLTEYEEDILAFCQHARQQAESQGNEPKFQALSGRKDLFYCTCLPWISYTHMIRTISVMGEDDNPKATWGKYHWEQEKLLLPFSLQVHHSLMDGYHVGRYFEILQQMLDSFSDKQ